MRRPDVADLVERARRGEQLAVARLISLVEDGGPELPAVAAALAPHAGRAHVVGLTGPPGVGKSTTTSELVRVLRAQGRRVGVLAVDPSSPFSGGALLGDRVRMGEHATDDGVFIRSMATRGHLGGLARATPHALRVLDAAGCDVVLIETVGVGQSEIEIVALADTTVVLLAPGCRGRGAGGQGRPARGGRRVRGEQGRPGRRRPDRAGSASDVVAGCGPGRGGGRAGGPPAGGFRCSARWPREARACPNWSTSSTPTGAGWTLPGSGSAAGWPGPARRSRPSRSTGSGRASTRSVARRHPGAGQAGAGR